VVLAALHDFAGRLVEGGVELRVFLQRLHRGLHEEGQVGQLDAVPCQPPLGLVAQLDQLGAVDFLDVGELCDLALGQHHVLGDHAAHAAERDAHVAARRCRGDVGRGLVVEGFVGARADLGRAHVGDGDLPARPRALDPRQIHAHFARQSARGRRGENAAAAPSVVGPGVLAMLAVGVLSASAITSMTMRTAPRDSARLP
jgi:hypothetical protein